MQNCNILLLRTCGGNRGIKISYVESRILRIRWFNVTCVAWERREASSPTSHVPSGDEALILICASGFHVKSNSSILSQYDTPDLHSKNLNQLEFAELFSNQPFIGISLLCRISRMSFWHLSSKTCLSPRWPNSSRFRRQPLRNSFFEPYWDQNELYTRRAWPLLKYLTTVIKCQQEFGDDVVVKGRRIQTRFSGKNAGNFSLRTNWETSPLVIDV